MKIDSELKILIVDDSQEAVNILKVNLRKKGFSNITSARNAQKAMEYMEMGYKANAPVKLLFVDWNMPEESGLDLLYKLREDVRFKEVPFIMVTAENEPSKVKKALVSGLDNYIIKPFNAETLFSKVSKTLKRAK